MAGEAYDHNIPVESALNADVYSHKREILMRSLYTGTVSCGITCPMTKDILAYFHGSYISFRLLFDHDLGCQLAKWWYSNAIGMQSNMYINHKAGVHRMQQRRINSTEGRGRTQRLIAKDTPDSKVHGANMGPIWGRQDPGGPHVGPKFCYLGHFMPPVLGFDAIDE